MRSKEELQKLLISLKGWYKEEFGCEYSANQVREPLLSLVRKRLDEFIRKRVDHLPGRDLVNFLEVYMEDRDAPIYVAPPSEIKKNASTKKSQKTH
jgi:hypothetical protein